jgi:L-lysine exporter family protein LysE/ArgO
MDTLLAFMHGFVLALGLILPLGVQNIFVFCQGATQASFARTLPVIVTAAAADTLLILCAVQGVSLLVLKFYWVRLVLLGCGVAFLSYIGWVTWHSKLNLSPSTMLSVATKQGNGRPTQRQTEQGLIHRHAVSSMETEETAAWPVKRQVMFALSVSLLNPHAILDTVGVIGTNSLSYQGEPLLAFTAAGILVSWLWFVLLAVLGRLLRRLDRSGVLLALLNRVSAVIMWLSGLFLLYTAVRVF